MKSTKGTYMEEIWVDPLEGFDFLMRVRIARTGKVFIPEPKSGKFVGYIVSEEMKILHFTEPIFDSEEEAEKEMNRILTLSREWDAAQLRVAGALPPTEKPAH